MNTKKIGVIAGGPVDSDMGVAVLKERGLLAYPYPAAPAAREQLELQMQPEELRTEKVRGIIRQAMKDGMNALMVYCNSLSSTVDFIKLSEEFSIQIVTPLDVYAIYGKEHLVLGAIAGGGQPLAGIERAVLKGNPSATVVCVGLLYLVTGVEARMPPAEMVEKYDLINIVHFFEKVGAEALILGCTHFPYFHSELKKYANIPIFDPAEKMYELLKESL